MRCEDFQDLIALQALGTLEPAERAALDAHLTDCPACREQLAGLWTTVGLLGYGAPPAEPSPGLKARVLDRIASEPLPAPEPRRGAPAPAPLVRPRWGWAAACAALALGLLASLAWGMRAQDELAALRRSNQDLQASLAQQDEQMAVLRARDAQVAALAPMGRMPQAQARVIWSPREHAWLLLVSGLPPAAQGKTYQFWAVTPKAKMPMGTFQTDEKGTLAVKLSAPEMPQKPVAAAISVEPAGGMPQPTGPIVLMGQI
jgi:anti-sigma-K factor RskA